MKNIKHLTAIVSAAIFLLSCSKSTDEPSSPSASSFLRIQYKGKTMEVTGRSEGALLGLPGVFADTHSESTSLMLMNMSGVYSISSVYGSSKEFELRFGASKKGDPNGAYPYSLLGSNVNNQNIYMGIVYDFNVSISASTSVLIGAPYVDPEVFIDYTDGGKVYRVVPSQSSVTITESSATQITGTFDLTCVYGTTNQKITGSFRYVK